MIQSIPNNWTICTFDDILEIVSGRNQKQVENPNGQYLIYGSGGKMGRADNYLCLEGTTIIGRKGTINSPIYVNEKFWNVDTAFGLSPKYVESKLLYYFCLAFNFKDLDKSTTIPSLAKTDLLQISFPLPPLSEQQRIVAKIEELFSELDKGIETLKTAQQQLKVYRQAVLKYAFEGKLTNPDFKEGELPMGWIERNLASVCEITSSKRIFKDEYVSEGIPFYRTKEVKELSEGKKPAIELYIEKSKYDEIKSRFQVPGKGDVLLSAVGTIGVSYVIRDEKPFYFKDGNLMWFRNLRNIDSYFLSYALTHFIRNGKDASVSGSAYNALTIETMKVFKVAIPEFKEQKLVVQEIESRLSVCDKIEETILQGLQQAEALRQSILKKAFEGKLVPQDPNDEPASLLLERIKEERAIIQPVQKTKTKNVK